MKKSKEQWFEANITMTLKPSKKDLEQIDRILNLPIYCFNSVEELAEFQKKRNESTQDK